LVLIFCRIPARKKRSIANGLRFVPGGGVRQIAQSTMKTIRLSLPGALALAAISCGLATSLTAQTLTNGLVFYVPFTGSWDDVAGGRAGTGLNAPALQATGGVGGGGYLQLQNDAVNPLKQAVWYSDPTPATNDFSFQVWVRTASADAAQNGQPDGDPVLASDKDWDKGTNPGWAIARETGAADGDKFQWNMAGAGGNREDFDPFGNTQAVVFDGNWHQVLVTFQRSGNARFYRDGLLIDTVNIAPDNGQSLRPVPDGTWITTNILALGEDATLRYDHGTGTALNGDLDEVAMWDRVLSPEEVAAAYEKGVKGLRLGDPLSPLFLQQPQGGTRYASDNFRLTCVRATDQSPLTFQWYRDVAPVPGATNGSVLLSNLPVGTANYTFVVAASSGNSTSAPASLTVLSTTNITNGIAVYLNFDNNLAGQAGTPVSGSPIGATGQPRYAPGRIGAAADFQNDGKDGPPSDWAVSLGDLEATYSNNWSVSLWLNTTNTNDGAILGNKDWDSGGNIGWLIVPSRTSFLNSTADGGPRRDLGSFNTANGVWHHVVAVFNRDANTIQTFIDGHPTDSTGLSRSGWESLTPTSFTPNDTLVGSSGNGRWSGTATVDDLGLWNRLLSPDEILAIYAEGLKGNPLTQAVAGAAIKSGVSAQPQSLSVPDGYPASFSVTAVGTPPLAYQWRRGSSVLSGQTNATLTLPAVHTNDSGETFTVVVSNVYGAATSSPPATLTVMPVATGLLNQLTVYLNFDNNLQGQAGTAINGNPIGDVGVPKYTNGIIGAAAARFDNDDNDSARASDWAVSLGDIESIYTNNWSFSIWVKTTDNYGSLFGNKDWYSGANIGWTISEYYTNWLNYTALDSPRHDIGSFNWADNNWHHLVAVFHRDGNHVYTFVDGQLTAQAPLSVTGYESLSPTDFSPNATLVGSSGNTADSGYGSVDDLALWTRVLGPQEILAVYASGLKGTPLPQASLPAPALSASVSAGNLVLQWPASAGGFTVESTPILPATTWTTVSGSSNVVGNSVVFTVPLPSGDRFFRLRQ
jgi:hypothetical protein